MSYRNSQTDCIEHLRVEVLEGRLNKFLVVGLHDVGNGTVNIMTGDSGNLTLIERHALTSHLQAVVYFEATTGTKRKTLDKMSQGGGAPPPPPTPPEGGT